MKDKTCAECGMCKVIFDGAEEVRFCMDKNGKRYLEEVEADGGCVGDYIKLSGKRLNNDTRFKTNPAVF